MADTRKRQSTWTNTQVDERFQSGVRLCDDAEASEVRVFEDLEVQDPARRARVSLAIELHLESRSHFFCGPSGDVVDGGIFVATYHRFEIGRCVAIELSLRGKDGVEAFVCVDGEVRFVREHSLQAIHGVGIAFAQLSDEDRDHIYDFCSMRPARYYDDVG